MNLYENVFIARQDLSPKQVEELVERFSKIITDVKGKIAKTEYSGLRPLAYPINKSRKGHYVIMHFHAPGSILIELERVMNLREDILRFFTTEATKVPEGASPLLKQSRTLGENQHPSGSDSAPRTHAAPHTQAAPRPAPTEG